MSQNITRRTLLSATALLAAGALSACGGNGGSASDSVAVDSPVTLTVAASPSPHAEILNDFAAPLLAEQGITLEVKEYTDYILPNQDTTSGEVDCNYFQHLNYPASPTIWPPSPTAPRSPSPTTPPTRVVRCCCSRSRASSPSPRTPASPPRPTTSWTTRTTSSSSSRRRRCCRPPSPTPTSP